MAKGSIATAWIQVLPSLEGLHSALVKASKGAVLTPAVQPKLASGTSRLFSSHGLGMSRLFSGSFNKSLNLQDGVKGALNSVSASFGSSGRRSADVFGSGFATLDLGKYLNAAAAIAAVASVGTAVKNVTSNIIEMGNQWGQTTAMLKTRWATQGIIKARSKRHWNMRTRSASQRTISSSPPHVCARSHRKSYPITVTPRSSPNCST